MTDFHLNNGNAVLNKDVDYVLQQIDMLFDTNPKEVLGDPDYGTQYDRYLYSLNISNEGIKNSVINDLYKLDLRGFTPEVEVMFLDGTERDIALIDIILKGEYDSYRRIYKITDNYENF